MGSLLCTHWGQDPTYLQAFNVSQVDYNTQQREVVGGSFVA